MRCAGQRKIACCKEITDEKGTGKKGGKNFLEKNGETREKTEGKKRELERKGKLEKKMP